MQSKGLRTLFAVRSRRSGLPNLQADLRWLIPILALGLLPACGQIGAPSEPLTPTPMATPVVAAKPSYTVQRGTVVETLEFQGRVTPMTQQQLFFRMDGYIKSVLVSRGDLVKAGDVLAELEMGDLNSQLAQADLAVKIAEARLSKALQDNEDALVEAQIDLDKIKLQLAQARTLQDTAPVTNAEIGLTRAQGAVTDAEREYREALERSWETDEGRNFYAAQLDQAKQNLVIAQAQYDDALSGQSAGGYSVLILAKEVTLAEARLEILKRGVDPLLSLEVEAARLNQQAIQETIDAARLTAPFDGEVLSLGIFPGDQAVAFRSVIAVGDPRALEVTANLGAQELGQLIAGQEATIRVANQPSQELPGRIRQLPLFSDGVTNTDTTTEDLMAHIEVSSPTTILKLGDLADVTVVLEQREEVLWLPPTAIRTFQDRDFVVVQDGDIQRRIDVRLGLKSVDRVEILEGLEEGQVAVGP